MRTGLLHAEAPACESPTLADQHDSNDRAGEEIDRAQAEARCFFFLFHFDSCFHPYYEYIWAKD